MQELIKTKNMQSKILIDWNEVPMVTIKLPVINPKNIFAQKELTGNNSVFQEIPYNQLEDARDKLMHKFVKSGPFALITNTDDGVYEVYSMNSLDVLQNMKDIYTELIEDPDFRKEYEQAILKVASFIEKYTSERSSVFTAFTDAQALLKG